MAQQQKHLDQFYSLLNQYKRTALPDAETTDLASTLELLETIDHIKTISDQQAIDILVLGCKSVDHQNALARSFCRFMYNACSKQIRITSFRAAQFDVCIKYVLDGLETIEEHHDHKVDLLRALSALVFENVHHTQRTATRLSNTLLLLGHRNCKPLEVRRMAINCIGNTFASPVAGTKLQDHIQEFYACLLSHLGVTDKNTYTLDLADTAIRRIASSTLRALQFLLTQDKALVTHPLCDITEILYTFIFMHVNVQSYSAGMPIPASTRRNRVLSQPSARPLQLSWRVPLQQKSISLVTSSESELSDSSMLTELSPRRQRDNAKIRINALLCLSAIAMTSPKTLYPHWHKFMPDTFSIFLANNINHTDQQLPPLLKSDNQPYSLFTILLYDPIVNVRTTVCHTLIAMLSGSKQYLSLASESDKHTSSFTSLSENLGSIIHDIHQGIIYAFNKEPSVQVLNLMMRVTMVLVENCSYERLSKEHLPSLYKAIAPHWKEPALHSAILKALSAIFQIHQDNLKPLIQTDLIPTLLLPALAFDVQEEVWDTCSVLTKTYTAETVPYLWDQMTKDNTPIPICAASLKYIASYASVMQHEDNDVAWWQTQINTYLQQAASSPSESVRTAACDCFASLSTEIFEKFHFQYQRLAVTLLLSLAQDTKMHVKAAACRALGVFVLFPSLREDPLFMSDMIKAILLHKEDKTILVRVRISWSIANLCDALVLESVHPDFELREYMDTPEWIDILNISIAALDHEKLKSNAVRAIGSLLRLTPQPYYANTRIMALVKQAVHGLIKHIESGLLKTRWNACHATSNMLSNPFFPIGYIEGGGLYPWTHTLYTALMHALVACKNFKVRINACRALTAPEKQIQYGDKLDVIIQSMIEAWDICQQHTDCKEMKYKQQLEQQIIDSLKRIQDWIPIHLKDQVNHMMHSFSHANK